MRVTTIRFNLKFFNANGEEDVVRTLDDLRSKFNLSDLCEYLKAGDLTRWLRGLNETRIAAEIESLRSKLMTAQNELLQEKDKIISSLEQKLSAKTEESDKKDASIKEYKELIRSFTEDASKKVSYEDYSKLREFTERAVELLAEKRTVIGQLQIENSHLRKSLDLSERRLAALADKQMKEEAAAKLVKIIDTVEPDPAIAARYEAQYQKFVKIYPALKDIYTLIK